MRLVVFFLLDLSGPVLSKEAEDSEGFIECKMSGPHASRCSLRESVGVKSEGK